MNVAYVRVSTVEQNEARQIEALKKHDIEKWFTEKVSGKNIEDREQLQSMLEWVREGDSVFVHDFSRLARSTTDLLLIVEQLEAKKVRLVSNKESLDTSTATGKLMLTVIAAINEFERMNLLERQKEGIAIAKAEGKYAGRKKCSVPAEQWNSLYSLYMDREISKAEMAKRLGVSRPTLYKLLKEVNEDGIS